MLLLLGLECEVEVNFRHGLRVFSVFPVGNVLPVAARL